MNLFYCKHRELANFKNENKTKKMVNKNHNKKKQEEKNLLKQKNNNKQIEEEKEVKSKQETVQKYFSTY